MNKTELVSAIAEKTGLSKKEAEASVNALTEVVGEAVAKGDSVQLVGFGTFSLKERAARKGRNPQTGAEIDIPASRSVGFKVGKKLKDSL